MKRKREEREEGKGGKRERGEFSLSLSLWPIWAREPRGKTLLILSPLTITKIKKIKKHFLLAGEEVDRG
jgi:hypothetical protein